MFWVLTCTVHLTVCSCHLTYAFQSEFTLYSWLNVKELLARSRREICSLSYCDWTWTHNHLVHKQTFNYLAKWLSVRLWNKWLWIRVQMQPVNDYYSDLFDTFHLRNLIKANICFNSSNQTSTDAIKIWSNYHWAQWLSQNDLNFLPLLLFQFTT